MSKASINLSRSINIFFPPEDRSTAVDYTEVEGHFKRYHLLRSLESVQEAVTLTAVLRSEPSITRISCLEGCDSRCDWTPIKLGVKTWSVHVGMMTAFQLFRKLSHGKSLGINCLLSLQDNTGNKEHFTQAAWLMGEKKNRAATITASLKSCGIEGIPRCWVRHCEYRQERENNCVLNVHVTFSKRTSVA